MAKLAKEMAQEYQNRVKVKSGCAFLFFLSLGVLKPQMLL